MTEGAALIGLRTANARHIADYLRRLSAGYNSRGVPTPLCGTFLDVRRTKAQRIDRISPAVLCPGCVAAARRWYAPSYFVPFDCVQRRRLLDALGWDLDAAVEQ